MKKFIYSFKIIEKIDQKVLEIFKIIWSKIKIFKKIEIKNKIYNISFLKIKNIEIIELLEDISSLYIKNKKIINEIFYDILALIRAYFYICLIMYVIIWTTIFTALCINNDFLLEIGFNLKKIYWFFTMPIKNLRFLIKTIASIPFKIISLLFSLINFILNKSNWYQNKIKKCECSGLNDDKYKEEIKEDLYEKNLKNKSLSEQLEFFKNRENVRKFFEHEQHNRYVTPAERELDCMRNRVNWLMFVPTNVYFKFNAAARATSTAMDYDLNSKDKIKTVHDDALYELYKINKNNPCPSDYKYQINNRKHDK